MSDRYHSLTVVLEKDLRDDDAQSILDAIKMVKGVLTVTPFVSNMESHMAEQRAKNELGQKLLKIVYPDL